MAPVAVIGGHITTSLALGHRHRCGLSTGGAAYCSGWNGSGQLGDGMSGGSRTEPVVVTRRL